MNTKVLFNVLRAALQRNSPASYPLYLLYKSLKRVRRDYEILPLEWMDQSYAHEHGLLEPGHIVQAHGPRKIGGPQQARQIPAPDIFYRVFRGARISATSSSLILENEKKCIVERFGHSSNKDFDYSGGHVITHGQASAIVRLGKPVCIEKGIFLAGNGSYNYYHWLIEIIPKLRYLSSLPEPYRSYPLLVNAVAEHIPSFAEILAQFAGNRRIIYLNQTDSYLVREAVFFDSPNNLPFSLNPGAHFDVSQFIIREKSIDFLRQTFLPQNASDTRFDTSPEKIFLCRAGTLRPYNQEDVWNRLKRHGFTRIFMENMTINQQILTMSNAKWIVGPTGAAWANLVFCSRGAKCLCWMAEETGEFSAFSTLAAIAGADMRYITYKTGARSIQELHSKPYILDAARVEQAIIGGFEAI